MSAHAAPTKAIPDAPQYYVLDEPRILSPRALQSLQTLLIEHDRATGEQILVAVFKSLDGEDLIDYTNRVFQGWKIGQRGKDNGVLLALYWEDRKARIEVGYGLEPLLTDARARDVLDEALIPPLKSGQPDLALADAAVEILKTLDSPLITSGQAKSILKSGAFGQRTRQGQGSRSSPVGLFIGIIFLIVVIRRIAGGDAHYTGAGWYRPRPNLRLGGGSFGGGFGSGGGGGGFSGGGGRSGGGGASGSW